MSARPSSRRGRIATSATAFGMTTRSVAGCRSSRVRLSSGLEIHSRSNHGITWAVSWSYAAASAQAHAAASVNQRVAAIARHAPQPFQHWRRQAGGYPGPAVAQERLEARLRILQPRDQLEMAVGAVASNDGGPDTEARDERRRLRCRSGERQD